jgi:membrane associated rhomboid family serine protease
VLIPLKSDRPLSRPTRVTYVLIAVNVAVALLTRLAMIGAGSEAEPGWYAAAMLWRGESAWWTYLTYSLLHDTGSVLHLLGNMLILWVFGPNVEDRFGRVGFLLFYLTGGVLAGVAHVLASPAPVVGASGAVTAVTGAFLVLFPRTRIRSLWVLGLIGFFMVPSWFFIGLAVARDIIPWVSGMQSRVAHEAHLGGYAFGIALSIGLLATGVLKREPYDLFQIARHAKRRRAFKAASAVAARGPGPAAVRPISAEERAKAEAIASARAGVSHAASNGDTDALVEAYAALRAVADRDPPSPLSRNVQLAVGTELYRRSEHKLAAGALSRFLEAYADDREAGGVRVLLARISARHLDDRAGAAALLEQVIAGDQDAEAVAAARREQETLDLAGAERVENGGA